MKRQIIFVQNSDLTPVSAGVSVPQTRHATDAPRGFAAVGSSGPPAVSLSVPQWESSQVAPVALAELGPRGRPGSWEAAGTRRNLFPSVSVQIWLQASGQMSLLPIDHENDITF